MSAKQPSVITSTSKVELSPEQREILNLAMPHLRQFAANPPELQPFSTIAPFTPEQVSGQEMALSSAPSQADVVGGAANAARAATSGIFMFPETNPALASTISAATRPIEESLLERLLPSIRSEAIKAGGFGGSRQGIAEGIAMREAERAIGDTAAKIATEGYKSGLDALLKGIAVSPQTATALTIPASTVSAVGDVRQAMEQALLEEEAGRFLYGEQLPLIMGKELASVAGGIPGGGVTSSVPGPTRSPLMEGLGLALTGMSLLGGLGGGGLGGLMSMVPFLSDRCAKDDIALIGRLFDGTPVYRFRYKGDAAMRIGLMADEVVAEAVSEIEGLKVIDVRAATENAARIGEGR